MTTTNNKKILYQSICGFLYFSHLIQGITTWKSLWNRVPKSGMPKFFFFLIWFLMHANLFSNVWNLYSENMLYVACTVQRTYTYKCARADQSLFRARLNHKCIIDFVPNQFLCVTCLPVSEVNFIFLNDYFIARKCESLLFFMSAN